MGKIHVLPERVANQIAAGEVVERPASVVKELLENALDAGSTRIRILVEAGGKKLIQITDNGCGMVRDDAMLAFERHATSKIKDTDDLLSVATLGYFHNAIFGVWPGNPDEARRDVRFELCDFLLARGLKAEAQAALMELATKLPKDADLHVRVADLFLAAADYPHALDGADRDAPNPGAQVVRPD